MDTNNGFEKYKAI